MEKEFEQLVSNALEKKMTTQEWVTDILRKGILNGHFKDGEPIPTAALSEKLGVSRMPIRIALMQLESEGLVLMEPHKPAVAVKLSPEEVLKIYDIRYELEGLAVQLAIEEMTSKQVENLVSIVDHMKTTSNSDTYMKLNNEFHNTLNSYSNNEVLINIINQLRNKIQKYVKLYLSSQMNIERANIEHQEIMDAILKKDPIWARKAVEKHLATTSHTVAKNLRDTLNNKLRP